MDNDDKVKPVNEVGPNKVQLFLQDSLNAIRQDKQQNYDLHEEFAKTKNNKDYFVVKIIAVVVILVALVSWSVTSAINQSSRNVKVDIAVFEDINLKNVLDLAKKAEEKLAAAEQKKADIQSDFRSDLSALALRKQSELDILAAQRMPDAARSQKSADIAKGYDAKKKSLNAAYSERLAVADRAIDEARKEMNSFDQKRVEEANRQKKMLDNQQDLFELEKKKIKDSYEAELAGLRKKVDEIQRENSRLKTTEITTLMNEYQARIDSIDPSFDDANAASYVESARASSPAEIPFGSAPGPIPGNIGVSGKDFSSIARGYRGVDLLLGKIASLPFEHDVDDYAAAARIMALQSGAVNERIINAAFGRLSETDAALERTSAERDAAVTAAASYEQALQAAALANEYAGYVLAVREAEVPKPPVTAEVSANADGSLPDAQDAEPGTEKALEASSVAAPVVPAAPILIPVVYFAPGSIDSILSAENPVVYVYRAPKTLIATLKVTKTDEEISISIEKVERNRQILPLDYISVKKR